MKNFEFSAAPGWPAACAGLAAGLLLAAGLPAAAQDEQLVEPLPVPQHLQLVAVTEDLAASIDLGQALAAIGAAGQAAAIVEEASLGASLVDGDRLIYLSAPGQFGRDRVVLEAGAGIIQLEIRVLPRFLPFAGRLAKNDDVTLGVFDNQTKEFLFCDEPKATQPDLPLNCRWLQVRGAGNRSLIPVVWPADKFGVEQPALYDLASGELMRLGGDSTESYLWPVEIVRYGDAGVGGWPLAGDWSGSGARHQLALVFEDGRVWLPETGLQVGWPAAQACSGELVWPVRVPAAPGGKDRLALVDPKLGHISWLELDGSSFGSTTGFEPHLGHGGGDYRRPLSYVSALPFEGQILPSFSFLRATPEEGLVLIPGHYLIGKPQTIPIKFPDDPPSGR